MKNITNYLKENLEAKEEAIFFHIGDENTRPHLDYFYRAGNYEIFNIVKRLTLDASDADKEAVLKEAREKKNIWVKGKGFTTPYYYRDKGQIWETAEN